MIYRRAYRMFDPFNEVERLQRQINSLFERQANATENVFPLINIWQNEDEALVTAELAGMAADEIELSVTGKSLTLGGKRNRAEIECTTHRQERMCGSFERTIELPFFVATDKINAKLDKGILTIKLPRAAEDKPRQIAIGK